MYHRPLKNMTQVNLGLAASSFQVQWMNEYNIIVGGWIFLFRISVSQYLMKYFDNKVLRQVKPHLDLPPAADLRWKQPDQNLASCSKTPWTEILLRSSDYGASCVWSVHQHLLAFYKSGPPDGSTPQQKETPDKRATWRSEEAQEDRGNCREWNKGRGEEEPRPPPQSWVSTRQEEGEVQ